MSLTECLCAADSARDGGHRRISASNEEKEWGDETGKKKKK
jgi:hypothetical protein